MDSKSPAAPMPVLMVEAPSRADEVIVSEPEEPFSWSKTSIAFLGLTIAIATIATPIAAVLWDSPFDGSSEPSSHNIEI